MITSVSPVSRGRKTGKGRTGQSRQGSRRPVESRGPGVGGGLSVGRRSGVDSLVGPRERPAWFDRARQEGLAGGAGGLAGSGARGLGRAAGGAVRGRGGVGGWGAWSGGRAGGCGSTGGWRGSSGSWPAGLRRGWPAAGGNGGRRGGCCTA